MLGSRQALAQCFINTSDSLRGLISKTTLPMEAAEKADLDKWEALLFQIGYEEEAFNHYFQSRFTIDKLKAELKRLCDFLNQEKWLLEMQRQKLLTHLEVLLVKLDDHLIESRQCDTRSDLSFSESQVIIEKTKNLILVAEHDKAIRDRIKSPKVLTDLANVLASYQERKLDHLSEPVENLYDKIMSFKQADAKKMASRIKVQSELVTIPDTSDYQSTLKIAFSHFVGNALNTLSSSYAELENEIRKSAATQEITPTQFRLNRVNLVNADKQIDSKKTTVVFVERLVDNKKPRSEIIQLPDHVNPVMIMANVLRKKNNNDNEAHQFVIDFFQKTVESIRHTREKINVKTLMGYGLNEDNARRCVKAYKKNMTSEFNGYIFPSEDIIRIAMTQVENFRTAYGSDIPITITCAWSPEYVEAIHLYCALQKYKVMNDTPYSIPKEKYRDDPTSFFNFFRNAPLENFKKLIKTDASLNIIYSHAKKLSRINKDIWETRAAPDSYITDHKQTLIAPRIQEESAPTPRMQVSLDSMATINEDESIIPLNFNAWVDELFVNVEPILPEPTEPAMDDSDEIDFTVDDSIEAPQEGNYYHWLDDEKNPVTVSSPLQDQVNYEDLDQMMEALTNGVFPSIEPEYENYISKELETTMRSSTVYGGGMMAQKRQIEDTREGIALLKAQNDSLENFLFDEDEISFDEFDDQENLSTAPKIDLDEYRKYLNEAVLDYSTEETPAASVDELLEQYGSSTESDLDDLLDEDTDDDLEEEITLPTSNDKLLEKYLPKEILVPRERVSVVNSTSFFPRMSHRPMESALHTPRQSVSIY